MYKSYDELGSKVEQNRDQFQVVEIQNNQHRANIISTNRIVCIDIFADWCGPCKMTAPAYANIAHQYNNPGEVAIVKYRFEHMDPKEQKQIHGIPAFHFFFEGRKVDEVIGGDIEQVERTLKNIIQRAGSSPSAPPAIPQHNRNTIRSSRTNMPTMDTGASQPYQSNSGNYHQPYQYN